LEVLNASKEVLGEGHPSTLTTMNNLVVDNLDLIDILSTQNLCDPNITNLLLPEMGPGQHMLLTTKNPNADQIPAHAKEVPLFKKANLFAPLTNSYLIVLFMVINDGG
jgi:hypothetical protein